MRSRPPLQIAVGIATSGRPDILVQTLEDLGRQTRLPDRILVCAPSPTDLGEAALPNRLPSQLPPVESSLAPRGLTRQRNQILRLAAEADLIVFLDDDFYLHPLYLERMEQLFAESPEVVVATGAVLADGINGPGLRPEDARRLLAPGAEAHAPATAEALPEPVFNAYGCNMVLRMQPIRTHGLMFDELLPLYGWYEDVDFSRQLAPFGQIVKLPGALGVHLGVKGGRTSGVRLGYSQVANPVYLARKGTMPWRHALSSLVSRSAKNAVRSFRPEPYVDRAGRLKGNLLGLRDLALGTLSPQRAQDL